MSTDVNKVLKIKNKRFCLAYCKLLIYFGRLRFRHTIKYKRYNISHCWARDTMNFNLLWKGLGLASPPNFVYDISKKAFLMLYPINWPNFIVWLPLFLDLLSKMCIVSICCPVCDVMNFKINRSFLIKLFFHKNKNSGQKCRYFKNEKCF